MHAGAAEQVAGGRFYDIYGQQRGGGHGGGGMLAGMTLMSGCTACGKNRFMTTRRRQPVTTNCIMADAT